MACIYKISSTQNSISVQLQELDMSYSHANARIVYWYLNGSYNGVSYLGNNVSAGGNYTFTELSPGTTYSIYATVYQGQTLLATIQTVNLKTESVTLIPPSFRVSSTSNTVTIEPISTGSYLYFKFSLYHSSGVVVQQDSYYSTSTTRTYYNLSPDTLYYVYCGYSSNGSTADNTLSYSIRTQSLTPPTLSVNYTSTSITAFLTSVGDYLYFKFSLHDSANNTIQEDSYYSTSTSKTYTNLSPNTKYIIYCGYSSNGLSADNTLFITVWTDPLAVNLWNWNASNGSATTNQTYAAYTAVTSKGETSDFSYRVWNDMCAKVYEVRSALGILAWDTTYLSYENTKMSSSDKTLTANRFNSLKYNIGSRYPTGISDVSTGDIVYGHYFTTLMSKLNEWIQML